MLHNVQCERHPMVYYYLLLQEHNRDKQDFFHCGTIQCLPTTGRSELRKVSTCLHFNDMGYHGFSWSKTISQEIANYFTHPLFKNWKFLKLTG